jgi:hypothetical protein
MHMLPKVASLSSCQKGLLDAAKKNNKKNCSSDNPICHIVETKLTDFIALSLIKCSDFHQNYLKWITDN